MSINRKLSLYLCIYFIIILNTSVLGLTISFNKYCMNDTNPDTLPATGKNSGGLLIMDKEENDFGWYAPGMNCSVTFTPPKEYQLLISFLNIKLRDNDLDILSVSLGEDIMSNFTGKHLCPKANCSRLQFTSQIGQNITFQFISTNISVPHNYTGFKAIYTVFKTASGKFKKCKGKDNFLCLNAHCIAKELRCNGLNNCGDMSDESICSISTKDLVWSIVAIAIAAVAVMLLVPLFCFLASRGTQNIVKSVTVSTRATPLYSAVNDNETANLLSSSGGRTFTDYWSSRSYENQRDMPNYGTATEGQGDSKPSTSTYRGGIIS